jgi:hypothetical protein
MPRPIPSAPASRLKALLPPGAALACMLTLLGLIAPLPRSQAQDAAAPATAPAATPAATPTPALTPYYNSQGVEFDPQTNLPVPTPRAVPLDKDPNDPKISRKEKIARQSALLQEKLKEARERDKLKKGRRHRRHAHAGPPRPPPAPRRRPAPNPHSPARPRPPA